MGISRKMPKKMLRKGPPYAKIARKRSKNWDKIVKNAKIMEIFRKPKLKILRPKLDFLFAKTRKKKILVENKEKQLKILMFS